MRIAKLVAPLTTAAIVCSSCGLIDPFNEQEAKNQAIEGCQRKVSDFAKYPAGAEFPEPIDPYFEEADGSQGPDGTAFFSVNLNSIANFPNGFGVPVQYVYSCVTYHDENGDLLRVQAKAKEKRTFLDSINYYPESDKLTD